MTIRQRIATVLGYIYGIGIAVALLTGGATFLGYLAALIIGGEQATIICVFIYKITNRCFHIIL